MDHESGLESASRQVIVWGDDNLVEPRQYKCSFCKRGFSNAQALGGHMNIHRRDRAKLKAEFSCDTSLSLDGNQTSPYLENDPPIPSKEKSIDSENSHVKDDHDQENRGDSIGSLTMLGSGNQYHKNVDVRSKGTMRYGELDLELRLGIEPHHHHNQDAKSNSY